MRAGLVERKRVFVTGITGTLGTAVAAKLLYLGHSVIGFSRDECKQQAFALRDKVTLYLGDIRDADRVAEAARGADLILHFAALKHVDLLESNPEEAVRTNIEGTVNVLHAQRMLGIPRVVLTSTDKAAYPVNAYGMSKGIAERLVLRNPANVVCRYGNVLASRGSVVEKFVQSLKTDRSVAFTDQGMTRFWLSADEAADFVLGMALASDSRGLCIPTMKAATLPDIASAVAYVMGIRSYSVKNIGVRAGEKTHECLRTEFEGEEMHSHKVARYTEAELHRVLEPIVRAIA